MNLTVIAEGAGTEAQLAKLRRLGCDLHQGFLVNKAVAGSEFLHRYCS